MASVAQLDSQMQALPMEAYTMCKEGFRNRS